MALATWTIPLRIPRHALETSYIWVSGLNPSPSDTAQAVVDSSEALDSYLSDLDGEDLRADVYFGMGLTEPGKFQGAGFFLGGRLLGGGGSDITEADRAVLAAYQEGLTFIATNGADGEQRPELFDTNGELIDPVDSLTSSASAIGAAIIEVGVAMSTQFQLFGGPIAAGISFKALEVELGPFVTFEFVGEKIPKPLRRLIRSYYRRKRDW